MTKLSAARSDRASLLQLAESAEGPPIPEKEAERVAQVLGELLGVCRAACDGSLAEEQPVGTFRVEET